MTAKYIFRLFVIEILALTASILIAVVLALLIGATAGFIYDAKHLIPNPVTRGDDLGGGLVVVVSMLLSLFVSVPVAIWIHVKAFRKILSANKKIET
jgi:hypothetical protein